MQCCVSVLFLLIRVGQQEFVKVVSESETAESQTAEEVQKELQAWKVEFEVSAGELLIV